MEKNKNVPKLRFPEFSGEWEEKKLGEIYSFKTTNSYSRDKLNYEEGNVKNIHYGDIHKKFNSIFDITNELVPFVNKEIILSKLTEDDYCKEGDLIIADASEDYLDIGKAIELVRLDNEKVIAGLHTLHARPYLRKLSSGFGSHILKSDYVRLQIKMIAQGTKVLSITSSRLSEVFLILPSHPEQTKIATFLTAVDEKLTQLKKKKTLLEQYKKGVMQKLFSQELRFKNNNNQDFPDWQEKTLGELSFKVDKKNKKNIQYPIYSINNINGFIPQSDQFDGMDSNKRGYDISLYKIIERNTFAYNPARINVGSLGYSGDLHNIIISSLYVCFKTVEEVYDNFLLQYFSTNAFNKAVLTNVEGGVREYLFFENFSRINLSLPSLPEQQKIATFLSSIDEKISHCRVQIEKMESWKKGLLQQMFC